jgi:hypothetical protein
VVELSCGFVDATVLQADEDGTGLSVPWHPGDGWYLPSGDGPGTWNPYTLEPSAEALSDGDSCRVGIAPQLVYIVEAYVFTSKRQPLPQPMMSVLPIGAAPRGGYGRYTNPVEVYLNPVQVVLQHRAYPWLRPGDRVRDAAGTELVFHPPMLFLTDPAEVAVQDPLAWPAATVPQWPLTLLDRDGRGPTADQATEVAAATATGCHDEQLDAWELHAGVHLPSEDQLAPCFLRIGPVPQHITYRPMPDVSRAFGVRPGSVQLGEEAGVPVDLVLRRPVGRALEHDDLTAHGLADVIQHLVPCRADPRPGPTSHGPAPSRASFGGATPPLGPKPQQDRRSSAGTTRSTHRPRPLSSDPVRLWRSWLPKPHGITRSMTVL